MAEKRKKGLANQLKLFLKSFFQQHHLAGPTLLVAYSGGLDSTVLLHALHQLQSEMSFYLTAMHVHHGLSDNADTWAQWCEQTCSDLGVPFEQSNVVVNTQSGLGVEAAARAARYQVLNTFSADFVCSAHHQDDQAETLLLQLARGAGVKGLSGMAQVDLARRLIRPFLHVTRAELTDYAQQHDLKWIDDESNADTAYDRNFMRHELLPLLSQRYSSIGKTLARSATNMAEASELLDDLAALDALSVVDAEQQTLQLDQLALLSQARQGNVIRFWLSNYQVQAPSAALLSQISQQLKSVKSDANLKVKVADGLYVMRYRQAAYLVNEPDSLAAINLLWQGEDVLVLPDQSRLVFTIKKGEGFAYRRGGCDVELWVKNRTGGELFKPKLGRPRRTLKAMLQASAMPPWLRTRQPLIFMEETLVIIPNIGSHAEMQVESHEMGLLVHWEA